MKNNLIIRTLSQAGFMLLFAAFVFSGMEPALISAATTGTQFTISQTVTSEIAFSTPGSNVTLAPSVGGITGGTGNGGTQVIVTTNDHLGYTMTLQASS